MGCKYRIMDACKNDYSDGHCNFKGEDCEMYVEEDKELTPEEVFAELGSIIIDKFTEDITKFAMKNWMPSHVDMLKNAIACVLEGKETYEDDIEIVKDGEE